MGALADLAQLLIDKANETGYGADFRMEPGYDHSYSFIATFIGEHIAFHRRRLNS